MNPDKTFHPVGHNSAGISIRDYIAIQAMSSLINKWNDSSFIASMSYELADCMIKESQNNGN